MVGELKSIDELSGVLSSRTLAVLTDMDGTLSPIEDRAADAYVPEGVKEALAGLVKAGVRVAVITGRSLEVARWMVDVNGVDFAASHGVDVWVEGSSERPEAAGEWVERARRALSELRGIEGEGVWIEDKEFGLAVHYRQASDGEAAHKRILEAIEGSKAAREFVVQEGRKIVELRPRLEMDKGTAAGSMIDRYGARGVVCLGDDVTDIDMFGEVRRRREVGLAAAILAVRSEEASGVVMEAADWWVDGVEGVEWLLGGIVGAVGSGR